MAQSEWPPSFFGHYLSGRNWTAYAFLLGVTISLYISTLYFGFVWDDTAYVRTNFLIWSLDWGHFRAIWSNTYLGHYAPLHHTLLALIYHFFELDPFGYHLGQVLIHSACVVLLFALLKKVESPRVALLACLLFAVHPTNVETVAWISESKSTLGLFFILLSFWFFMKFRGSSRGYFLALSALFLVLSALSKINTIVAPAAFLLYDYRTLKSAKDLKWRSLVLLFAISAGLAIIHIRAFGNSLEMLDGQLYSSLATRLMNFPLLVFFYLDIMVLPVRLSAWEVFPAQETLNWIVILGWIGFALLLFLLMRATRETQFWALWILVFLLPVLQIVAFPIWVADRYLYIPLIGGATLAARLFYKGWDRLVQPGARVAMGAVGAIVVLALAWRTMQHVPVWRDDLSLWAATTPTCMTSAYCHASLGLALMAAGHPQRGGDEIVLAAKIQPNRLFLMYLGDALTRSAKNYPEAIRAYQLALKDAQPPGVDPGAPRLAMIYSKLARAYILSNQWMAASQAIQTGKQYDWRYSGLWVMDAFINWYAGDLHAAKESVLSLISMIGNSSRLEDVMNQSWGDRFETQKLIAELGMDGKGVPR